MEGATAGPAAVAAADVGGLAAAAFTAFACRPRSPLPPVSSPTTPLPDDEPAWSGPWVLEGEVQ